jgi:hypothetical protein
MWLAVLVVSCGPVESEQSAQPAIATNAIATNAIATNALTTNAIASAALAAGPLAGQLINSNFGQVTQPDVVTGLEDPDAQMLMAYLVGCALESNQRLRWTSRFTSERETWRGELGLCPAWLGSTPSAGCLERVSACLLARNNVFGISVPVSLRGDQDGTSSIALAPTVALWPKAWRTNTTVPSSQSCNDGESGVDRNCGWQGVGVGRCTPGQSVSVGAGCGLGSSSGNAMLRICTRMHFCDAGSADLIAQNDDGCGTSEPAVTFTCPSDGFYAVMAANQQSADGPASVDVAADPPRFPSSEGQVFTWREGAFYGNIFAAGALNPLKPQVRVNPFTGRVEEQLIPGVNIWVPGKTASSLFAGVAYQKMWACSSNNWTVADGYFERRMCAGLGGINCAAKYAGPCGLMCADDDSPPAGDHDYGGCSDLTLRRWSSPITPFLNHPCDLLGLGTPLDEVLCSTLGALPLPPPPP